MPAKPTTIDEYLDGARPAQRAALERLRQIIHAAAPVAEEGISYGLAAFRLGGKPLVAFGATASHCAFFPMSGTTVAAHAADLAGYDTSKGTVRFQPDKPLPVALVRKLVNARIAEMGGAGKPATGRKQTARKAGDSRTDAAVELFLSELDHPLKADIQAVRKIVLGADSAIHEGIKWNSVSFRTTDFFTTVNLRSRDRVQLVFHTGAKAKATRTTGVPVADPAGLITWLAKDRCLVTLGTGRDIRARRAAFVAIVREWIRHV